MNRPIIVLLLLIPTLAFSKLVTVEFTPDEETEIREAIKDRSLRKDTIPRYFLGDEYLCLSITLTE